MGIADLIDRGIKAYLAGRERDALIAFREVLRLEPDNAKARWYVDKLEAAARLQGGLAGLTPAPVPAEAPPPEAELELDLPEEAPEIPPVPLARPAPHPVTADGGEEDPTVPGGGRSLDPARLPALDEDFAPSPWDDGPAAAATIVLDPAGGLELGAISEKSDLRPLVPEGPRPEPEGPKTDVEVWLSAAKELFALGDFSGSLELIEKILQVDPEHGEARDYLRQNEATLISMYESKLGPLGGVPRLAVKPEEVLWLNLDHRAGFLLAQIDGTVDYESLFALSGLPRLDTARILANLLADGVIVG